MQAVCHAGKQGSGALRRIRRDAICKAPRQRRSSHFSGVTKIVRSRCCAGMSPLEDSEAQALRFDTPDAAAQSIALRIASGAEATTHRYAQSHVRAHETTNPSRDDVHLQTPLQPLFFACLVSRWRPVLTRTIEWSAGQKFDRVGARAAMVPGTAGISSHAATDAARNRRSRVEYFWIRFRIFLWQDTGCADISPLPHEGPAKRPGSSDRARCVRSGLALHRRRRSAGQSGFRGARHRSLGRVAVNSPIRRQ